MHPGLYHIFNQFTISQYLQYRPKDHSIWPFLPGRDLWMSGVMTLGQHKTHVATLSEHLLFMNRTSFTNKTMKCKNPLKGEFYIRIFSPLFSKTWRKLYESHHIEFFEQQHREINLMHFNFRRETKSFNTWYNYRKMLKGKGRGELPKD